MQNTMVDRLLNVDCKVTGIGSVPHKDIDYICELILNKFPDIPYCPQFSKIDARENMFLQCSENLPCLKPDLEKEHIYYDDSVNKEEKLLEFYDHLTRNSYEYFVLYPNAIKKFLARNGVIVWGAVPTAEYRDGISLDELCQKLNKALNILERKGIDKELLMKNSLFSPSCGMGLLNEKNGEKIMNLTSALAERMKR